MVTGRTTFNAFDGSNLAQVLTDIGTTRPLFAGFATDQCVQKTFRCALTKGLDTYMVTDCSATFFAWLQRKTERAAGDRAVSHAALHDLLRQPAEPG